ncbi:hypothetical protein ACOKFD_17305 [Flagellimonas sp. S174]|uniref:hypothetical protein n=1 Tax=Flagellimonas sp. S174 TaxID=3410790 RepID=UPI003BF49AC6
MILKKTILISLYFLCIFSFGQKIESDSFFSRFILNDRYGELFYCDDKNHFTLKLVGNTIQEVEIEGSQRVQKNQHFISIDGIIIQTISIPIPKHLRKIDSTEPEKILDAYLNYELDFIKNELKVNISDVLMMPGNFSSRKYLLWKYKLTDNMNINDGETVKGQIHLSTICFNQVLTLSIPMIDLSLENKYRRKLVNLARRIKLNEKPCEK